MSSFFKSSFIYLASTLISSAIPFILLPILTRYLSPEDYGKVAMFQLFISGMAAILGLGVVGAANRKYFDENITPEDIKRFNGNCLIILMCSTIVGGGACLILKTWISNFFSIPESWVFLGIIVTVSQFITTLRLGQWQVRNQALNYGKMQVSQSLVNICFSLLLVIVLTLGGEGRVYGILIASLFAGLVSLYSLYKRDLISFIYNKTDTVEALKFGLPLVPHLLGFLILSSIDRLFINNELGVAVAGVYMVAVQLGSSLTLVFQSLNKAFSPWLFDKLKKDNLKLKADIVKKTYYYFLLLCVLGLLSYFVAPVLLKLIVGEKFEQAADVIGIIVIGNIFNGMYLMVTNYMFYAKSTYPLTFITPISGLLNIALLYFLIPSLGIYGASLSFVIANGVRFIMTWIAAARLYKMPWTSFRLIFEDKK